MKRASRTWHMGLGFGLALSACAGERSGSESDMAISDTTGFEDTTNDVVPSPDEGDVEALCPGGCSAFDGPCMRGLCGAFGCQQIRLDGLACDDGLACTSGDRCARGMCVGETSTCGPGVVCGDVFCPGEGARCVEGHCEACDLLLVDADCESPRYPYLRCPNMPGGRRVMARLLGRVPTTGPLYYLNLSLQWADTIWGEPASGFCEIISRVWSPAGCGLEIEQETIRLAPALQLERLQWEQGEVSVLVAAQEGDIAREHGPVCDGVRLGGARLTIEVEP